MPRRPDARLERASAAVHAELMAVARSFAADVAHLSSRLARGEHLDAVSTRHVVSASACLRRQYPRARLLVRLTETLGTAFLSIACSIVAARLTGVSSGRTMLVAVLAIIGVVSFLRDKAGTL